SPWQIAPLKIDCGAEVAMQRISRGRPMSELRPQTQKCPLIILTAHACQKGGRHCPAVGSPVRIPHLDQAPPIAIVAVARKSKDADWGGESKPTRRAFTPIHSILQAAVGELTNASQAGRGRLSTFALAAFDYAHCGFARLAHGRPPFVRN